MNGQRRDGTRLLATLTGRSAQRMAGDRAEILRGLMDLGREAAALVRGYASEDPAVREAAHRRWAQLDAMLPVDEARARRAGGGLSKEDRVRVRTALTQIVESLEEWHREMDLRDSR
jgi:hypothetical protein